MPPKTGTPEKILARLKGLRSHMQPGEEPLFTIPAIWDSGQAQHSTPCDVVVTNQRILGYAHASFPRERLFLDALPLAAVKVVSLREKSFEPIFRELLVGSGQRKIYIRAPHQKIENLYQALRSAINQYAPTAQPLLEQEETSNSAQPALATPVYGRQELRTSFERSPLGITLLFTCGLLLEIVGVILWSITHSPQTGLPLFIAGLLAVITAFFTRRQK